MLNIKSYVVCFLFFLFSQTVSAHNYGYTKVILDNATAPMQGIVVTAPTANLSIDSYAISCTTKGSGDVSASINLLVYNSLLDIPINVATLSNAGTSADVTAIAGNVSWKYITVEQTEISGTVAATTCTMSY